MSILSRFDFKSQFYSNHNKSMEATRSVSFWEAIVWTLKGYLYYLPIPLSILTTVLGIVLILKLA